ncbi:MAG: ribbon-helix-helix domain-containing protein [Azospirillaceae bacterium]|nr:ribbon-helix-helix domain-containing protein [Azospirillaceae bacterium]
MKRNFLKRAIDGISVESMHLTSRIVIDAAGKRVRIRLERGCWQILAAIAADGGPSVDEICRRALLAYPGWPRASAVRMFVLRALRETASSDRLV